MMEGGLSSEKAEFPDSPFPMKITDEHLYHGAALTQIAEHPSFTAINGIRIGGKLHRSAFRINDSIGVYFKYASKPTPAH